MTTPTLPRREEAFLRRGEARRLRLIALLDERDGSASTDQHALLYVALFDPAERAQLNVDPGRKGYVDVARASTAGNKVARR